MTLAGILEDVDRHDPEAYVPLRVEGRRYGWIRPGIGDVLAAHPDVFRAQGDGVSLQPALGDYESRTAAVDGFVRDLRERGLLMGWWDEPSPVVRAWDEAPIFEIERGGLDPLGLRAFGVHLNGFVRTAPGGISLWVGRRSRNKGTYPGQLDHIAAGGQPLGLSPRANMLKECAEEAAIPEDLATTMTAHGSLSYRCAQPAGLNDDTIFCFDLELPHDFRPRNRDGEVASFTLEPVQRVIERLRTTRDFKFNVGPVILDFLVRRGLLPRGDPEYDRVTTLLDAMRERAPFRGPTATGSAAARPCPAPPGTRGSPHRRPG